MLKDFRCSMIYVTRHGTSLRHLPGINAHAEYIMSKNKVIYCGSFKYDYHSFNFLCKWLNSDNVFMIIMYEVLVFQSIFEFLWIIFILKIYVSVVICLNLVICDVLFGEVIGKVVQVIVYCKILFVCLYLKSQLLLIMVDFLRLSVLIFILLKWIYWIFIKINCIFILIVLFL